jgi:hypothetical protein
MSRQRSETIRAQATIVDRIAAKNWRAAGRLGCRWTNLTHVRLESAPKREPT